LTSSELSTPRDICFAMYLRASFRYTEMFLYTYVERFPEYYPSETTFSFHEHLQFLSRKIPRPVGIQNLYEVVVVIGKGLQFLSLIWCQLMTIVTTDSKTVSRLPLCVIPLMILCCDYVL
jgi:hypothetical protein